MEKDLIEKINIMENLLNSDKDSDFERIPINISGLISLTKAYVNESIKERQELIKKLKERDAVIEAQEYRIESLSKKKEQPQQTEKIRIAVELLQSLIRPEKRESKIAEAFKKTQEEPEPEPKPTLGRLEDTSKTRLIERIKKAMGMTGYQAKKEFKSKSRWDEERKLYVFEGGNIDG